MIIEIDAHLGDSKDVTLNAVNVNHIVNIQVMTDDQGRQCLRVMLSNGYFLIKYVASEEDANAELFFIIRQINSATK